MLNIVKLENINHQDKLNNMRTVFVVLSCKWLIIDAEKVWVS